MFCKEVRKYIITPTLQEIGPYREIDDIMVYGTGHVESNFDALIQSGTPKNGGVGFFQKQPLTYLDCGIWLKNGFNKGMMERILNACDLTEIPSDPNALMWNLKLAVAMCRVHYHRVKQPFPDVEDASGMADYHAKYYNCGGKANVEKNTVIFQKIINGEL